eukprot:superscaffoldBa00004732_g19363
MSVNSSNSSHPPHPLPSSLSVYNLMLKCFSSTAGFLSITAFTITIILFVLPLCILVLYLGHQRWRQQRSGTAISHSDLFTYHMVITELTNILGSILSCCSVLTDIPEIIMPNLYIYSINLYAQMSFHILTCVERYLAVVHPVTYLGLRKARGIRIRNITIGCVWLLCFVTTGPGEGGGSRQQVQQSKLRAFYTIMAILGVLLLRFGQNTLSAALYASPQLGETG